MVLLRLLLEVGLCFMIGGLHARQIHLPPDEPFGGITALTDSTATYSASGSGPGIGETFVWTGSGNMIYGKKGIPLTGITIFDAAGQVLDSTQILAAVASASEANAIGSILKFQFNLDPDSADLLAGNSSVTAMNYFCADSRAKGAYSFKWGPVPATNDTAPDPKSAR